MVFGASSGSGAGSFAALLPSEPRGMVGIADSDQNLVVELQICIFLLFILFFIFLT